MRRGPSALATAAIVAVALPVVAGLVPANYVALLPGPVTNTLGKGPDGKPLITIQGRQTYPTSGTLDLTTVSGVGSPDARLSVTRVLRGWADSSVAVVPMEALYPPGQSTQQVERQNTLDMTQSQEHAITAALRQLDIPVTTQVVVASVGKGTPADGKLRAGDVILAVDGVAVRTTDALRLAVNRRPPGSSLVVAIRRGSAAPPQTVAITTAPDPDHPKVAVIGVVPGQRAVYPFSITIGLKNVGGPSAGLMFALGIVDKLTPGKLNGGLNVAGTGAIDDNGKVGPIGGIQQKMRGARRAGATIFLAPAGDCQEAKGAVPSGLRVVSVRSLDAAVQELAAVVAGRPVTGC